MQQSIVGEMEIFVGNPTVKEFCKSVHMCQSYDDTSRVLSVRIVKY